MNRRRSKKLSRDFVGAALTGDTARLQALLRAGADPEAPDRYGTTPLHLASVQGEAGAVSALLRAGTAP
ncbi:hypothetical protein [Streptomyces sp. NPDC060184]|uniref:hypothetical protein n=1 Tax=Streptomyces sp. NPDC060184 TaxID=3347064 RepID=UPI003648BBC1